MSLFGEVPKPASQPVKTVGKAEIFFDGGCLGNPGQKYGSFQIKLDGKEILKRVRVDFGFGTNNEAEFNALKLAADFRRLAPFRPHRQHRLDFVRGTDLGRWCAFFPFLLFGRYFG